MEKNVKDYLHFYVKQWCDVVDKRNNIPNRGLNGEVMFEQESFTGRWVLSFSLVELAMLDKIEIKPHLRKLSSMTQEEMNECWFNMEGPVEIRCEYKDGNVKRFDSTPAQVHYLLYLGFDLFGLIESELAIEKQS